MPIFSHYPLSAFAMFTFLILTITPVAASVTASISTDSLFSGPDTSDTKPELPENLLQEKNIVGEARLKILFWKVYDARLYAPERVYSPEKEFALSLVYLRDLKGDKITERTIKEIKDQGFNDPEKLAIWEEKLTDIIPVEVKKGSDITGLRRADGSTIFYMNKEYLGRVDDPGFSGQFFNIWLGPDSSVPEMREKLIGNKS